MNISRNTEKWRNMISGAGEDSIIPYLTPSKKKKKIHGNKECKDTHHLLRYPKARWHMLWFRPTGSLTPIPAVSHTIPDKLHCEVLILTWKYTPWNMFLVQEWFYFHPCKFPWSRASFQDPWGLPGYFDLQNSKVKSWEGTSTSLERIPEKIPKVKNTMMV